MPFLIRPLPSRVPSCVPEFVSAIRDSLCNLCGGSLHECETVLELTV